MTKTTFAALVLVILSVAILVAWSLLKTNEQILATHHLVVNTTPVGMFPHDQECPEIPTDWLDEEHYIYDLVYNPVKTMLLKLAEQRGAQIKNGLEMLHLQAEKSWEIWNA